MPVWLSGLFGGLSSFFGGMFRVAKDYIMLYLARRTGRSAERSDMREEANKIKEDQLRIAAKKTPERREIIDAFKDGKL